MFARAFLAALPSPHRRSVPVAVICQSLIALSANLVSAQTPLPPCVTDDRVPRSIAVSSEKLRACPTRGICDNPADRDAAIPDAETPIKYITVKFQSVSNDDGSDPLFSRAEAESAIDWLNHCYEPWRIQFVYDHRRIYSTFFHDVESWYAVDEIGARFSVDTLHNLNILTTNYWCEWQGQTTLCGGARGPWQDPSGVPLWSTIMTTNHWRADGLICHEIGHNFGLIHTFGEFDVTPCGRCDEVVGAGDGDFTGDFCSDTPPTPVDPWNTRCAPAPGTDRCSGLPWGETDYRNWMAYTPYAPCKDHFTPQQAGRMHCWLEDVNSEWISYAKIEADVDTGAAPLRVQFDGLTSMTPDDWRWDFGDGTVGHGPSPAHVYSAPGIYRPTVTLAAAEGNFEATMSRDIWVHADSLSIDDVEVTPGTEPIRVPLRTRTSIPVDHVDLPLHWDGPADLVLDSVSTLGLISDSYPAPQWLDLDATNMRGCLRIWTVDSLAMEPGEGALLELRFSADPEKYFVKNDVRLADYGDCRLQLMTDRGPYRPQMSDGSVLICEGSDCERADVIRRPTGRRQTRAHQATGLLQRIYR